jgi:hypothetical protein
MAGRQLRVRLATKREWMKWGLPPPPGLHQYRSNLGIPQPNWSLRVGDRCLLVSFERW